MSKFTFMKDTDRLILEKLDDGDLLKVCSIDKYTWNNVCDDNFLRRRLLDKYPQIEQYKLETETWKNFFLRVINYTALLKEHFNYVYSFGDFKKQYNLLKEYGKNKYNLIRESSKAGELSLVIWTINTTEKGNPLRWAIDDGFKWASEKGYLEIVKYLVGAGANIHAENDYALREASKKGHLETVKYLVEAGADIHAYDDTALINADFYGNLEVVKYLVEKGANIHAFDDEAIRRASSRGHLEMVKYLVEAGANIHAKNEYALRYASANGHLEVVKYLVEAGANIHADDDIALIWAFENEHLEVANYLMSKK